MVSKADVTEPITAEAVRVDAMKGGLKLSVREGGRKVEVLIPIENVTTLINMLNSAASMVSMMSGQTEH